MREDRKWKRELKHLFPAPPPEGKEEFLKKFPDPELTAGRFLWHQAAYIRKWNWLLAAGLFAAAVLFGRGTGAGERGLRILAAGMPGLALAAVAEGSRSVRFGMEELELSSRFSLKTIVMARLGILGVWNLTLLFACIPLVRVWQGEQIWLSALYLLIPYLLTAFGNLAVVRHISGNSGLYLCVGVTVLVSVGVLFWDLERFLKSSETGALTLAACAALLAVLTGYEYVQIGKQAEEYRWNLESIV